MNVYTRTETALTLRNLLVLALAACLLYALAQAFPHLAHVVRDAYAPQQPTRLYCPPDSCVMVQMRDGSTCRVWRAPYGSAKPVRWSCP